jgi:hypothetical protein
VQNNFTLLEIDITGNICGEDVDKSISAEIAKNKMIC